MQAGRYLAHDDTQATTQQRDDSGGPRCAAPPELTLRKVKQNRIFPFLINSFSPDAWQLEFVTTAPGQLGVEPHISAGSARQLRTLLAIRIPETEKRNCQRVLLTPE
jgi:hypothetical protein